MLLGRRRSGGGPLLFELSCLEHWCGEYIRSMQAMFSSGFHYTIVSKEQRAYKLRSSYTFYPRSASILTMQYFDQRLNWGQVPLNSLPQAHIIS